ncbi:aminopeptidase P family protein [bacterium]|nr:aminopeptidase P family protein [bacterium]
MTNLLLSEKEKERRYKIVREIMEREGIDVILAGGNEKNEGYVRYFWGENYTTKFLFTQVLFPREGEPILFVAHKEICVPFGKETWIKDTRGTWGSSAPIIDAIKEKGYEFSTIGITPNFLPAGIYIDLKKEFPKANFVDAEKFLLEPRLTLSEEEIKLSAISAKIADQCYLAVKRKMKPGITEFEIRAIVEETTGREGGEDHFTPCHSGPSPILPWIKATNKPIKKGECCLLEITPKYKGYWTQLCRLISFGKIRTDVKEVAELLINSQQNGVKKLKPGNTVADVCTAMEDTLAEAGFKPAMRFGHFMGGDLSEMTITRENDMKLKEGMVMVLHPSAWLNSELGRKEAQELLGQGGVFGPADTYVVTATGYRRLNQVPIEIITV